MSDQLVKFVFSDETGQGGGKGGSAGTAPPPGPVSGGRASRQQSEDVTRSRQEKLKTGSAGQARPADRATAGQAEKSRTERALNDAQSAKAIRLASESFGKLWVRLSDAVQARLIRKADDYAKQMGLDRFFGALAKRFKDYFDALGNPNGPRGGGRASAPGGRTTVVDSFVKGFQKARGGSAGGGSGFPTESKSAGGRAGGGLSPAELAQLKELGGDDLVKAVMNQMGKGGKASAGSAGRGLIIDSEFVGAGTAAGGRAAGGALTTTGGGLAAAGGAEGGLAAAGGGTAAGGAALASNPVGWAILAALAVVVVTIGAAVLAVKGLTMANNALKARFGEVSERLKPFSSAIQISEARAGVAKLRQDVEFAGRLGGGLGRFNAAEARIERALDRIGNTINGPLLQIVLPFVERAAGLLDGGAKAFDAITTIADRIGLLKSPLAELINLENQMLGYAKDEALKLPPEADILGIFNSEPYLTVSWRGRTFGADEDRELGGADKKTFANPLPVVGIS